MSVPGCLPSHHEWCYLTTRIYLDLNFLNTRLKKSNLYTQCETSGQHAWQVHRETLQGTPSMFGSRFKECHSTSSILRCSFVACMNRTYQVADKTFRKFSCNKISAVLSTSSIFHFCSRRNRRIGKKILVCLSSWGVYPDSGSFPFLSGSHWPEVVGLLRPVNQEASSRHWKNIEKNRFSPTSWVTLFTD